MIEDWAAKEATNDWSLSAIGAGSLRTQYTPLTLSIPNINGMRLDFQSANTTISILNSRKWGGIMLRGGQFRRKLGVLNLGATYANYYNVQNNREGGRDWYGTVGNRWESPITVAVRFSDDSPEDGNGGPIIHNVRLKVNGRFRDDIVPTIIKDDLRREWVTAITKTSQLKYLDPPGGGGQSGSIEFPVVRVNERMLKYADYFFLMDHKKGYNIGYEKTYDLETAQSYYTIVEPNNQPIQVSGYDFIVYMFDIGKITEDVQRIEAITTVANDYNVQTTMIYTSNVEGGYDTSGKHVNWYRSTYWRTMAQAEGNVKDGSNIKTINLDFGWQVGSSVYGVDADFNFQGFKVKGEYVINSNHYMYPDGPVGIGEPKADIALQAKRQGHKWALRDEAYYLTASKEWTHFGFAGEIFKMGKFYRPWLDVHIRKGQNLSYGGRNQTIRFPLIEDNDDGDMYPDQMAVKRTVGYYLAAYEDPDGVFPGNDVDGDGIPDNNRNMNNTPDYDEDFLMFDLDPDEFVFGNDYNNNTIPDHREDDMKYDTPYDLDRRGHHLFFSYSPIKSVKLILGSMRTKGIGLWTKTYDDYFKLNMNYDVFGIGNLFAEYRYEEIQDNVRDIYFQVATKQKTFQKEFDLTQIERFSRNLFYDELEYKNSKVNRLFLDSKIRAVPSILIENYIKLEQNKQIEGTMFDSTYQPYDELNTYAVVNKIVYSKVIGNFEFSPGIKLRLYKKARSESLQPLRHYTMRIPLVMFKYHLSPRSQILLGFQGIPGLEFRYVDYINDQNDYSKVNYLFQVQNSTDYFGYQIWAGAGIGIDKFTYDKPYRKLENYKSTRTFVTIHCGF